MSKRWRRDTQACDESAKVRKERGSAKEKVLEA
jgi:hypothetical protein